MKTIGLISDTHSYLDENVLHHFSDVDEIWHAGDIGTTAVTDALAALKPLRAVHGNIDGQNLRIQYPEDLIFEIEGFTVWITHIGGYPAHYSPRVRALLKAKTYTPDIFICGHSHILRVMKDPLFNMYTINSGAAGREGFHKVRTVLKFQLENKRITNMQAIELGKR